MTTNEFLEYLRRDGRTRGLGMTLTGIVQQRRGQQARAAQLSRTPKLQQRSA